MCFVGYHGSPVKCHNPLAKVWLRSSVAFLPALAEGPLTQHAHRGRAPCGFDRYRPGYHEFASRGWRLQVATAAGLDESVIQDGVGVVVGRYDREFVQ